MKRTALAVLIAIAACSHPPPRRVVIANRTAAPAGPDLNGFSRGSITEQSLQAMMSRRFAAQLADGTFVADYNGTTADLLDELDAMGIHDLDELARIIPPDYDRRAAADFTTSDPANIPGVLRDFFIIHDAKRYFGKAWKSHWQSLSGSNLPLYRTYGVDLDVLVEAGVTTSRDVIDASSP